MHFPVRPGKIQIKKLSVSVRAGFEEKWAYLGRGRTLTQGIGEHTRVYAPNGR